jgi:hypothetical protein
VLDRVRDRLRRDFWHALNHYDELKRRVRENQAGRQAVGLAALLLLGGGAALGFIAANATARQDIAEPTPARASNLGGAVYTVTQATVRRKTVRVIAAKPARSQSRKTVTITRRSPTLPARTVASTKTIAKTRTVTVKEPVTVTVVETVTEEDKKHGPGPCP